MAYHGKQDESGSGSRSRRRKGEGGRGHRFRYEYRLVFIYERNHGREDIFATEVDINIERTEVVVSKDYDGREDFEEEELEA